MDTDNNEWAAGPDMETPNGRGLSRWTYRGSEAKLKAVDKREAMTYRLEIRVPMLPPNANQRSRISYVNDREEREFADLVHYKALEARGQWENRNDRWPTLSKATVTIQFVTRAKDGPLPDYANLWETTKRAKDRLTARPSGTGPMARVGAGLIWDDAPSCLTWGMPEAGAQVIRGNEDMTIITITGGTI